MTLITEDGTGRADAESLCSVAYADSYHDARGNAAWLALTEIQKEQALRRSTDYLEHTYSARTCGYRAKTTQALAWPRYMVKRQGGARLEYWASDAVPNPIAQACAEMAFKAGQDDLDKDIDRIIKSETVGPLKTEYLDSNGVVRYRQIDKIMAQFIEGSSSISMVRS
ncbi:DnaT-like ssDNA-binding protein [Pseudomonas moorei]|uniref:Putative DnaT-like domain-containing protein n=1 Tax=Pseudomonas moorei TaxID=395599 RepID=A0A1H1FJA8_9PSED|nr:DnaT-like ssDNA-binding protein [Pseudomonas moorei]KAB0509682.1 hypothetical protein F7R06_01275 [Pseudomonas moorei]SDR00556.1 hypothetical protein SAMN04490195_2716 [Pseudomonas moorei]